MPDLHILVVVDAETGAMRIGGLGEAPVDSDDSAWDPETDSWRTPTDAERDVVIAAEARLGHLLALPDACDISSCGEPRDYWLHKPASECEDCRAPRDHHDFVVRG